MKSIKAKQEQLEMLRKDLLVYEREHINNEQIMKDMRSRNVQLAGDIKHSRHLIEQLERDLEVEDGVWHITDHVVIRYMERKMKLPLDDVRAEILEIVSCYDRKQGNTEDFLGFVLKGNSVVTYKG